METSLLTLSRSPVLLEVSSPHTHSCIVQTSRQREMGGATSPLRGPRLGLQLFSLLPPKLGPEPCSAPRKHPFPWLLPSMTWFPALPSGVRRFPAGSWDHVHNHTGPLGVERSLSQGDRLHSGQGGLEASFDKQVIAMSRVLLLCQWGFENP